MEKINNRTLLFISLFFVIGSLIIYSYTKVRLIAITVGLLFFIIYIFKIKCKMRFKFLILLIFILSFYGIDTIMSYLKIHEPIIAIKTDSNKKVTTFNGLFYRVYRCDNKLTFDYLYQKSFPGNDELLSDLDVNSFLSNIEQSYKKYKNKFVKISGKISAVGGSNILELATYEITQDSINGHVSFGENLKLKIYFKQNLETFYKVYDNVTVIGRITKLDKNKDVYTLMMHDSTIKETDLYDDYEIIVNNNPNCNQTLIDYTSNDDFKIKNYCLQNIYIKYDAANVYDLSYVLLDKKLTIKDLLAKKNNEINDYDTLYEYDDFNILQCQENKDLIIGSKDLNLTSNLCPHEQLVVAEEESPE